MTQAMTTEEVVLRARLDAQIREAMSPHHQAEALAVLGPDATKNSIMSFFITHHGKSFAHDWEMTMSDFNCWVTGIKLGRNPDPIDCWWHYVENVPHEEQCHHNDFVPSSSLA